ILSEEEIVTNSHNVYYIGTHDNDTLKGWYLKLTPQERQKLRAIMRLQGYKGAILDALIKYALERPHRLVVLYLGDLLKLDNKARINKPGIIDDINWTYRLQSLMSFIEKEEKIRQLIFMSQRL
ncbi:MAG: 4-alpha-glucanotransferase, partial [Bacilli bacterium]